MAYWQSVKDLSRAGERGSQWPGMKRKGCLLMRRCHIGCEPGALEIIAEPFVGVVGLSAKHQGKITQKMPFLT